jgi:hypothetical protein
MQPISAYTSLIEKHEGYNPIENWPANIVALYGDKSIVA